MSGSFFPDLSVRAHPSVLDRGWAGFARHHATGQWEFHCTSDTLEEPLELVALNLLLNADPSLGQLESLPPMSQAWRWEPNGEFQTSRIPIGPTYFFHIEASPIPEHPEYGSIGGALVNCWIRIESETEAREFVERELTNARWVIKSMTGPEITTDEDYEEDDKDAEHYRQAQMDGDVFVFHTYPPGDA